MAELPSHNNTLNKSAATLTALLLTDNKEHALSPQPVLLPDSMGPTEPAAAASKDNENKRVAEDSATNGTRCDASHITPAVPAVPNDAAISTSQALSVEAASVEAATDAPPTRKKRKYELKAPKPPIENVQAVENEDGTLSFPMADLKFKHRGLKKYGNGFAVRKYKGQVPVETKITKSLDEAITWSQELTAAGQFNRPRRLLPPKSERPSKKSQYRGVSWNKNLCFWTANVYSKSEGMKFLGTFESEIEAAKRYDLEAASLNRPVNFPTGGQKQASKWQRQGEGGGDGITVREARAARKALKGTDTSKRDGEEPAGLINTNSTREESPSTTTTLL